MGLLPGHCLTTDDHNDDYIGDDDHAGGDVDDGDGCMEFTRALFDKSNSAREVREESGPEVVLVNFWANSIMFNLGNPHHNPHHNPDHRQHHLCAALRACWS